jgi:hypothetical protein
VGVGDVSARPVVDAARMVALLATIAAQKPFYSQHTDMWGDSRYVRLDGALGCIAGHVLHRLGVPLGVLVDSDGLRADLVAEMCGVRLTGSAAEVLWVSQMREAGGQSWGVVALWAEVLAGELAEVRPDG